MKMHSATGGCVDWLLAPKQLSYLSVSSCIIFALSILRATSSTVCNAADVDVSLQCWAERGDLPETVKINITARSLPGTPS